MDPVIYKEISLLLKAGKSDVFIRRKLIEKGIDEKSAIFYVNSVEKEFQSKRKIKGLIELISGILVLYFFSIPFLKNKYYFNIFDGYTNISQFESFYRYLFLFVFGIIGLYYIFKGISNLKS